MINQKEMRKQLAVEWFVQQLRNGKELNDNLIQQAKEIEREGKQESYDNGYANGQKDAFTQ